MQQNKADLLINVFKELPEVSRISKSIYVSSIGDTWSDKMKYDNPQDSVTLYYNYIDSAYIPLHDLKLLAGSNLHSPLSGKSIDAGIIINEKTLQWMGIENPADAIGEEITLGGEKLTIKGVVKDFHYNTLNFPIGNFAFRYYEDLAYTWAGVVNLKIQTDDLPGFMDKLEAAWKKVDPVHPIQAEFYDEKIAQAYDELVGLVKIIGFLAFLAISIASLGLLGIVVSSTESRFREISIRKVFGATKINLIYLVSRSFILLLLIASAIAIPAAYYLFDAVIFENQTYRTPVGFFDLFAGSGVVIAIALLAIGSQTIRVARSNPAEVLKNE